MSSDSHLKRTGSGLSWIALILGVGLGVTLALFYTWNIDPVVLRETAPRHLSADAREQYVAAIALSYAQNQDLNLAFDRLRSASPDQNVWSLVAEIACNRIKTGKTVTNADIRVIRALKQLYLPQGASGCADDAFPTPAPAIFVTAAPTLTLTPTLTPPATKTPTPPIPTNTPGAPSQPTSTPPSGGYEVTRAQSFCDPDLDGVIEVRVYDRRGQGVPGVIVRVTWSGNQTDTFYTGLKPEQEAGYADFKMERGLTYTVTIPKLVGNPPAVDAGSCDATDTGRTVTTSYRINFQERAN
jgi:hypothetical protein